MSDGICPVCDECYMTATSVEIILRMHYLRMRALFSREPDAKDMFKGLAQDETEHARVLEEIRKNRVHSQLVHENAPAYTRALLRLVTKAGDSFTREPLNLQEAWEFACQLEGGEINEVYQKLTSEGHKPSDLNDPIVKQLNEHIHRLKVMGEQIPRSRREEILPNHG